MAVLVEITNESSLQGKIAPTETCHSLTKESVEPSMGWSVLFFVKTQVPFTYNVGGIT